MALIPSKILAEIETAYVTGDESYRKLAARFGVSSSQVLKLGKDGGWVKKRQQYRSRVVSNAVAKRARADSDHLARLMHASDKAAKHIEALFDDPDQFRRHIVQVVDETGASASEEVIFVKRDAQALRNAVAALRELTSEVRDLYRLPTLQQEQAQQIAVERLEMERARQAQQNKAQDATIRVVFDDDLNDGS